MVQDQELGIGSQAHGDWGTQQARSVQSHGAGAGWGELGLALRIFASILHTLHLAVPVHSQGGCAGDGAERGAPGGGAGGEHPTLAAATSPGRRMNSVPMVLAYSGRATGGARTRNAHTRPDETAPLRAAFSRTHPAWHNDPARAGRHLPAPCAKLGGEEEVQALAQLPTPTRRPRHSSLGRPVQLHAAGRRRGGGVRDVRVLDNVVLQLLVRGGHARVAGSVRQLLAQVPLVVAEEAEEFLVADTVVALRDSGICPVRRWGGRETAGAPSRVP